MPFLVGLQLIKTVTAIQKEATILDKVMSAF